jgi:hypothetical protein
MAMAQGMNPAAPHHLPPFITGPGETDVFLVGSAIFLIVAVISLGTLYFRLHALPEHLAHGKASKLQFEVVAVLALLALFTHNSWFWVAALLLALIPIPDFYGAFEGMASSLAKMARMRWPALDPAVHDAATEAPSSERDLVDFPHQGAAGQSSAHVVDATQPDVPAVAERPIHPERTPQEKRIPQRREEA